MDIFNPQLVDREPTERLGACFDIGAEEFVYIRARDTIRRYMPIAIAPDGTACETVTLAPIMAVSAYEIPRHCYGWAVIRGRCRVDPAAKRKLDAEAMRLTRNRH